MLPPEVSLTGAVPSPFPSGLMWHGCGGLISGDVF